MTTTSGIDGSGAAEPAIPMSGADQAVAADGLAEKQQMIEKLFRHTNQFLEDNKHDPLLVVEALGAILVRYTALFGPIEQMADRLAVLQRLVASEALAIQQIAKTQPWSRPG